MGRWIRSWSWVVWLYCFRDEAIDQDIAAVPSINTRRESTYFVVLLSIHDITLSLWQFENGNSQKFFTIRSRSERPLFESEDAVAIVQFR